MTNSDREFNIVEERAQRLWQSEKAKYIENVEAEMRLYLLLCDFYELPSEIKADLRDRANKLRPRLVKT